MGIRRSLLIRRPSWNSGTSSYGKIRYVKIPQISGHIPILPQKDGKTIFRSVEYIYERSRKKKEHAQKGEETTVSTNKKVIIGSEAEEILEGWMITHGEV